LTLDAGTERDTESDTESATEFELMLDDGDDDCSHFNDTRYLALKCLSKGPSHDKYAADCLAQEVEILRKLPPHSNIIKIFGISTEGFILLQRVRETLDELLFQCRLRRSLRKQVQLPLYLRFTLEHRKEQSRSHQLEQRSRVQIIALGLARAMAFVHHHGVLYRDLKPANVGIDYQGQVRLLDFGCARTCDEEQGRLLTHMIGTPRYMSPEEVACSKGKYGFPSDVHSFAMVLWEMLALRKPFENAKCMKDLIKALHAHQKRPSLKPVLSFHIRSLLKASWNPNPDLRPTFALIVNELEKESK
jgi:serine/threonine protein kinase